ncbi:putative bifunctional diguanylate cyclase/phosphodiesterase [Microvirga pudoricolor]|uniref:putative bifunctional diguanylate cyclase/phosphodiesterase n=1 Tax=Microvirga pudoricolor TaxID=2778729 RepID=UPI00195108EA|nr:EAL domain-containing protein [Microvirga pudoricolor]MBM6593622.1 EAL domain-containing protein [Microvirga pudoricolor]
MRQRTSFQDLGLLAAFIAVVAFLTFEVDLFVSEGAATLQEETIELDEALLLGGLLAIGLLGFAIRRYMEQKRETQRRIRAEQHSRELAYQDPLTGLANRRQFEEALAQAVGSPPGAGGAHALFLLDLNGFKQVNDVHGHGIGDEVLIVVAQRLLAAVREGDLVARLGGDEFAILAQHLIGPEAATSIALRVIQGLSEPIATGTIRHEIGTGIGIALIPGDAQTTAEALRKADVALYRAKAEKRSALRFFEEDMDRLVREREEIERKLRTALAANAIRPFFQPSFDLRTREIVGFEVTPRWLGENEGEIPPERFIPIAEETGLIHGMAERLLRESCEAAVSWPDHVILSIDIFPSQIKDRSLTERILRILDGTGLAPSRLEVEITESAIVRDLEAAKAVFGALREAGVKIALDNFGTGYSSLYHVKEFKLDKIKIDRSFTETMNQEDSARIISALAGLGHGLGLTVSAAGMADPSLRAPMLQSGIQQVQGDVLSRPLSVAQAQALLMAGPVA